jgi:hypothetical protein
MLKHKKFYNKTFFKQLILSDHCYLYCHSINNENVEFLCGGCLHVILPSAFTLVRQAVFRDRTRNQKPPPLPPTHTQIRVAEEKRIYVNPGRKTYFCTLFWTGLY